MKRSRGQIAIFLIVGIALLIGFAFLMLGKKAYLDMVTSAGRGDSRFADPVQGFVQSCLEKTAQDCAFAIGRQGGYYTVPDASVSGGKGKIPLYYRQGTDLRPTKGYLSSEFARFIEANLSRCAEFSNFTDMGYAITAGSPTAAVVIASSDVKVTLTYPLTIKRDGAERKIDSFTYSLPLRLDYVILMYTEIVGGIIAEPQYKDLTQMVSYDYDVMVAPVSATTDVYIITTFDHGIKTKADERYNFMFAVER